MAFEENWSNDFVTTLAADMSPTALSCQVTSAANAPAAPFRLKVITAGSPEYILVTGIAGTTLSWPGLGNRGLENGSAAAQHYSGDQCGSPITAAGLTLGLVRQILAGTNVSLSPAGGQGVVTASIVNNPSFSGLVSGDAGFRDTRGVAGANGVWLFDEQTISAGTSFTIPGAGSFPTGRMLRIYWRAKTDNVAAQTLFMRFNGDSGGNYVDEQETASGTAWTVAQLLAQTWGRIGAAADSAANTLDWGVIEIPFYADAAWKGYTVLASRGDPGVSSNAGTEINTGYWKSTAAITSITILLGGGNFNSGGLTKFATYVCS